MGQSLIRSTTRSEQLQLANSPGQLSAVETIASWRSVLMARRSKVPRQRNMLPVLAHLPGLFSLIPAKLLGHLLRRPLFIAFDLAQAGHGTADTPGKLFSGQVQRFAPPRDPGAE
jgi:hypothetical protein